MRLSLKVVIATGIFASFLSLLAFPLSAADSKTVRVYVDGQEQVISTKADTVGEVLERIDVDLDNTDRVEPAPETEITESGFHINIFRARNVMVVDEDESHKVLTAHQSPKLIAEEAGIEVYKEDVFSVSAVTDFVEDEFVGEKIFIDRATPVTLFFDGEEVEVRTQKQTVKELLKEQGIVVRSDDQLSNELDDKVTEDMKIIVVRVGNVLQTKEEKIGFDTKVIYDSNKPVGWSEVQIKGAPGIKIVSYQVNSKTGKKTALQTVVKKQPTEQVEKRGNKPNFDGDFAAALAKLRSCEGGYESWNPAGPYYGAYQFDRGTWSANAPAGAEYGNASPAEQDQAARNLYEARGWQPWPHCGASLPDIYR